VRRFLYVTLILLLFAAALAVAWVTGAHLTHP